MRPFLALLLVAGCSGESAPSSSSSPAPIVAENTTAEPVNEAPSEQAPAEAPSEQAPAPANEGAHEWTGDGSRVRVIVASKHALLGSEEETVSRLRRGLEGEGRTVIREDSQDVEQVDALAEGSAEVPHAWREEGSIIALAFHEAEEGRQGPISRGVRALAVMRAPDTFALYRESLRFGTPYYRADVALRNIDFIVEAATAPMELVP